MDLHARPWRQLAALSHPADVILPTTSWRKFNYFALSLHTRSLAVGEAYFADALVKFWSMPGAHHRRRRRTACRARSPRNGDRCATHIAQPSLLEAGPDMFSVPKRPYIFSNMSRKKPGRDADPPTQAARIWHGRQGSTVKRVVHGGVVPAFLPPAEPFSWGICS